MRGARRPSMPQFSQRQWRHASRSAETKGSLVFRFMSYNILADYLAHEHRYNLYRSQAEARLQWPQRWKLILREIKILKPDILCLQEVDHYEDIRKDLVPYGYVGVYAKRTGECHDGCATFWKSKFLLTDVNRIYFNESMVLRNNVAVICVLRCPAAHRRPKQSLTAKDIFITVANTHVLFNPKRGDIKLGQVRVLCDEVSRMSQKCGTQGLPSACIIAGDFNSSPESGIYTFMCHGSIQLAQHTSRSLSGTVDGEFSGPVNQMQMQNGRDIEMATNFFFPPWHPFPADEHIPDRLAMNDVMEVDSRWWPDHRNLTGHEDAGHDTGATPFRHRNSFTYDLKWAFREIHPGTRQATNAHLRRHFPYIHAWSSDHIENAMGRPLPEILEWAQKQKHHDPFVLDHDLHLKSAYREILGDEPKATSLHDRCQNTLDYIFFSPYIYGHLGRRAIYLTLQPLHMLDFPQWSQGKTDKKLPDKTFGSDHFSLCMDFCCKWTDRYAEAGLSLPPPSQGLESLMQNSFKRLRAQRLQGKRRPRGDKNSPKTQNYKQRKKQMKEGDLDKKTQQGGASKSIQDL